MIEMKVISNILKILGVRCINLGYIISNPSYLKVRTSNACPDIYKLLNKPWFPHKSITTVLDVGTNEGQFIRTILALIPDASIYGFEPNPEVVKHLESCDFKSNKVKISPIACGREKRILSMNISKFSPSSSLLSIAQKHLDEFRGTDVQKTIDVQVDRLDTTLQNINADNKSTFLLKIDVQGFELEVLIGAEKILAQTLVVLCEANIAPLYTNQCSFESILGFMKEHGFDLVDMGEPFRSKASQELLYVDLAFLNRGLLLKKQSI
jgi:FkbM family methyltransferase